MLCNFTNTFDKLESELVPFLYLAKKVSYEISMETDFIMEATNQIRKYLEKGFKEPNEILEKFRKYGFLFERSADKVVK